MALGDSPVTESEDSSTEGTEQPYSRTRRARLDLPQPLVRSPGCAQGTSITGEPARGGDPLTTQLHCRRSCLSSRLPEDPEHTRVCAVPLQTTLWRKPLHPQLRLRLFLRGGSVSAVFMFGCLRWLCSSREALETRSHWHHCPHSQNDSVCRRPLCRLKHTQPPAALPWKRFSGTPTIPPSVDFIVPEVQVFHLLSNSQNFTQGTQHAEKNERTPLGLGGQQPEVATANLKHRLGLCSQCERPRSF